MKGMFVSNRNLNVTSTFGHSIDFKKGEPTYVPPIMRKTCIEKGILPVEEEGGAEAATELLEASEKVKLNIPPEDADERKGMIELACRDIAKRNHARDFTGGGTPSAVAVTATLGWKVDQKEVKDVWVELRGKLQKGE